MGIFDKTVSTAHENAASEEAARAVWLGRSGTVESAAREHTAQRAFQEARNWMKNFRLQ